MLTILGTPVHNKLEGFYSLVCFLRLEPRDDKSVWRHWIGFTLKHIIGENKERLNKIGKALILRRSKADIANESANSPIASIPGIRCKKTM